MYVVERPLELLQKREKLFSGNFLQGEKEISGGTHIPLNVGYPSLYIEEIKKNLRIRERQRSKGELSKFLLSIHNTELTSHKSMRI